MTIVTHYRPGEMAMSPAPNAGAAANDGCGPSTAPIVVAVDGTRANSMAAADAVLLARDIRTPVVFVYVRRGPSTVWGKPFYQRRLTRALAKARSALEPPYMLARDAGVDAEVEILEGSPSRRIAGLAAARRAQLVVVGSRRGRLRRSVSRRLIAASNGPVWVAPDEESGRASQRPGDRRRQRAVGEEHAPRLRERRAGCA
jgi:nucleotide-binding universal stress UspA family protein